MVRVLNIIGSMQRGGAQAFVMNLYRNIDRKKVQFDFLVYSLSERDDYVEEIRRYGGKIYKLPAKSGIFFKRLYAIEKIVKEGQYNIVWRHTNTPFKAIDLIMARIGGAGHTILHSHSANVRGLVRVSGNMARDFFLPFVTDYYACGKEAGEWMYGRKRAFRVIPNGIETRRYVFDPEIRRRYRKEFRVEGRLVIGHVGRFSDVKNHTFLLRLLAHMIKAENSITLVLVGDGELREKIEREAETKKVSRNIIFTGVRQDIENLMQMMDVFVMPSLYEGFPVTLVEAQASDLPCVVSDRVPREVRLVPNVSFLSLDAPMQEWADEIMGYKDYIRRDNQEILREQGYDILETAQAMQSTFCDME